MERDKITANAEALIEALGDDAEAEAGRKVKEMEEAGDTDGARAWREIRQAVREIRGRHET